MRIIHTLALASLLPLAAACADKAVTEPQAAAAGPSAVMGPWPACVTFGPNPPPGTIWGTPFHPAGTLVHSENSIRVSVEPFTIPGGPLYNQARLEDAALIGWGTLNSVLMRDISTGYHFMAAGGWVPNTVRFRFQDLAPIENLGINGALYVGDFGAIPAAGMPLGGAWVTRGAGWINITGPVHRMLIGGQALRVDDVCATP